MSDDFNADEALAQADESLEAPFAAPDAPVSPAPPASPAGNGLDLNALNQELRTLGNYSVSTPADVANIVRSAQKEMREKQEAAARLTQERARYAQFTERMDRDQNYRQRVFEASKQYVEETAPMGGDAQFVQAMDPVYQNLDLINRKLGAFDLKQSVETLSAKYPEVLGSNEAKASFVTQCMAADNYDAEYMFWRLHGDSLVANARATAAADLTKTVAKNNAAYPHGSGPTSPVPPGELRVEDMTEKEKVAWRDRELEKIAKNPRYAAEVAAQFLAGTNAGTI